TGSKPPGKHSVPGGETLSLERSRELLYVSALIKTIEKKAGRYSPLYGSQKSRPDPGVLSPWLDEDALKPLIRRQQVKFDVTSKQYEDIISAFEQVKQAALLGAPGSGK